MNHPAHASRMDDRDMSPTIVFGDRIDKNGSGETGSIDQFGLGPDIIPHLDTKRAMPERRQREIRSSLSGLLGIFFNGGMGHDRLHHFG